MAVENNNNSPNQNESASGGQVTLFGNAIALTPTQRLKAEISFSDLLRSDGHKLAKRGKRLACRCPFHRDKTPSFFVSESDTSGYCFGCNWKGDIFDYEQEVHKLSFPEAIKNLEGKSHSLIRPAVLQGASVSAESKVEKELTVEERVIMREASEYLANETGLCAAIAKDRGWEAGTIQRLAEQGYLGWFRGMLAFLYPNGMKRRDWPQKRFRWDFGSQGLWRAERIPLAESVYVTEGETDCITLVDAGFEMQAGCAVVCCPGATAFKHHWAPLFKGKRVILCFDNDEAGGRATANVAAQLQGYAKEVATLDFKEVAR